MSKYIDESSKSARREITFWEEIDGDDENVLCARCYSVFTREECEDFFYCPICGRSIVR